MNQGILQASGTKIRSQGIRASQFITTYGPGAILEGPNGPRIILDANIGLFAGRGLQVSDYIIRDRSFAGLKENSEIFRLPSNAELGEDSSRWIYRTNPFPSWFLCTNRDNHPRALYILHQGSCPVCTGPEQNGPQTAVSFVMACPNGHLDDIYWNKVVHAQTECTYANKDKIPTSLRSDGSFLWHSSHGTLRSIIIECPRCGLQRNFGDAYYSKRWKCSGRFPEKEAHGSGPNRPYNCTGTPRMVQRQASNLRILELGTFLSIRSGITRADELLRDKSIQTALMFQRPKTSEEFRSLLASLVQRKVIGPDLAAELSIGTKWDDVNRSIDDAVDLSLDASGYHGVILTEFKELCKATEHGSPPKGSPQRSGEVFEVDPNCVKDVTTMRGAKLKIAPIQKLRTVTVQLGYRREVTGTELPDAKLVRSSFSESEKNWYPGVEFMGEGLFIAPEDFTLGSFAGKHASEWMQARSNPGEYPHHVFRDSEHSKDELHPGFVWLHTLAHLLIRAIGEEAGYSAASIRERIYCEPSDGAVKGGILLYATQPGSEGTMGGLISMADHFENILADADEMLWTCSCDPLCGDNLFKVGGYMGASCYGCTMNSETSCEHRNMWLDRNVLMERAL